MCVDPDDPTPSRSAGADATAGDPLDEVVARCLEAGGELEAAVRRACEERPADAPEIRRRLQRLRAFGLLASGDQAVEAAPQGTGPEEHDFPERLGDFQLLERLGGGGMGIVYRARQVSLGREVALKLIRPEHLYFPQARARFRRETEAAARLQHAGIVPIHTVGEERGLPFFAMELVPGATLADGLRGLAGRDPAALAAGDLRVALAAARPAWMPPPPEREDSGARAAAGSSYVEAVLRLLVQVADALQHAHSREVLHRDVKPSNVAVTPEGRALLLDFGLAALTEPVSGEGTAEGEALRRLTASTAEVGSLPYMAPEQLRGRREELGPWTDVYGLGVTLYECLALRLPFDQRDPLELRRAILEGAPRPLRAWNRAVGRDLETVCARAMERSPARRYADAAALARDLRNVLDRRPVEARPPGPLRELAGLLRRHPLAATLVAVAVAVPSVLSRQQRLHAQELQLSLDATDLARATAERERAAAQVEARTAGEVNAFLVRLFKSVDPSLAQGREVTARELLDAGARQLEDELATEPVVRMRLLTAIGESYGGLGQWEPALATLEGAVEAGADLPESKDLAHALSALATLEMYLNRPEALERAQRAAEVHRRAASGPDMELADTLLTLGMGLYARGRLEEAEAAYAETLEVVEQLPGDQRSGRIGVLANLANLHMRTQEYGRALEEARESVELQRSLSPDPHPAISSGLSTMARALVALGRPAEALPVYDEALELERRLTGESDRYAVFVVNRALALAQLDRLDEAISALEQAVELVARVAPPTHTASLGCRESLAVYYIRAARWGDALARLLEDRAVLAQLDDARRSAALEYRVAQCREALGQDGLLLQEARAALEREAERAVPVDDEYECQLALLLARALVRSEALGEARAAFEAGRAACGQAGAVEAAGPPAWLRLTEGRLARAEGDQARAAELLAPLAELEERGGAGLVPALARLELAGLLRGSDPPRARDLAARARAELEPLLGAEHPEARAARELLGSLP